MVLIATKRPPLEVPPVELCTEPLSSKLATSEDRNTLFFPLKTKVYIRGFYTLKDLENWIFAGAQKIFKNVMAIRLQLQLVVVIAFLPNLKSPLFPQEFFFRCCNWPTSNKSLVH